MRKVRAIVNMLSLQTITFVSLQIVCMGDKLLQRLGTVLMKSGRETQVWHRNPYPPKY